jgi:hypothetical protein
VETRIRVRNDKLVFGGIWCVLQNWELMCSALSSSTFNLVVQAKISCRHACNVGSNRKMECSIGLRIAVEKSVRRITGRTSRRRRHDTDTTRVGRADGQSEPRHDRQRCLHLYTFSMALLLDHGPMAWGIAVDALAGRAGLVGPS